jgi:predicted short-subunit dehydrogenase-like oxidoreductase (DUF2520 family)
VQKNKKIFLPKNFIMFSRIAIIGTGNIGIWLFQTLKNQNNLEVFSFSSRKIEMLPTGFDLYIFALKDDIYENVFRQISFKMTSAVHTSGSLSQTILAPYSEKFGVVYPYQSITNYELKITNYDIPICIEASDLFFEATLFQFANSIFDSVHKVNEKQRFAMHLAAVFANNFTNAMYGIAYNIFKENNLEWSLIFPLLENTLERVKHDAPQSVQTGPAKRDDVTIMEKHCKALKDEDLKTLYQLISKKINQ